MSAQGGLVTLVVSLMISIVMGEVIWTRGSYNVLKFSKDLSYTLSFGNITLKGAIRPSAGWTTAQGTAYNAEWGTYTTFTLLHDGVANLRVEYYPRFDAFIFVRNYTKQLQTSFPYFSIDATVASMPCASYRESPMVHGELEPLRTAYTDGPLFCTVSGMQGAGPAFAFAPMDRFSVNHPNVSDSALTVSADLFGSNSQSSIVGTMSFLFMARPGLLRATRAWGSAMRQRFNTYRARAEMTEKLAYWDDNAAGYSFWSVGTNLSTWGNPEEIFIKLYEGYKRHDIPIKSWEVDSNFAMESYMGGWCWKNYDQWNTSQYASGGDFYKNLGHAPMVYYVPAFCVDNDYKEGSHQWEWVDLPEMHVGNYVSVVHPSYAYDFYYYILQRARNEWNMQGLFADFLCWRGPQLSDALPEVYEAGHLWLEGMTRAAMELGLEIQYCMSCPHQILDSLRWGAVTNARSNGDGGMDVPSLVYSGLLNSLVGVGWSKDNLRLSTCSVPPCHAPFAEQELQTALAALSLGPVGLADQLTGHPTDLNVDVNTNITLALSLTAADGNLLQPSYPLTALAPVLVAEGGMSPQTGNVWATYTSIPGGNGQDNTLFWSVLAFSMEDYKAKPRSFTLLPEHLAPIVDAADLPPQYINDVPQATFMGAGDGRLPGGNSCVAWDPTHELPTLKQFGSVELTLIPHQPTRWNIVCVPHDLFLLGERGKVAAVSTYRFTSVTSDGETLRVGLRGAPGEKITLGILKNGAFQWVPAVIEEDGTGTLVVHNS